MILSLLLAAVPRAAQAQLGPYPLQTRQATFEASIVKRDKDILWIERKSADGLRSPQIGLAVADILQIGMPRPAFFDAVEKIRTTPGTPDAQFKSAHDALDKFILQTRSLRDLPGIPANEALLLKGRLYDAKGLWREALRYYEDVVTQAAGTELATTAQILAGIAYAKGQEWQFAVEYLGGKPLPEDEEELLSQMLFALGDSYLALENYDLALLSYLQLVVFYPFVHQNEPRALAAALACYAKLGEWEPLYRTIQEIKQNYPGTDAVKTADALLAEYQGELAKAGQFVDAAKITSSDASAPAEGKP